jgi:hypothetical protein
MMLDKLSAENRHIILILIVVVLTWAAATIPALGLDPIWAPLAGGVITALLAYFTPLTRQYGVGSARPTK